MTENLTRQVERDKFGRKIATTYSTEEGIVARVNRYVYTGMKSMPSMGIAEYHDKDGEIARIVEMQPQKDNTRMMVPVKDTTYDKNGPKKIVEYDPETRRMTKQKDFYTNDAGFKCIHRQEYDENGALKSQKELVRLGIGVLELTPEVSELLNRYNQHYEVNPIKEEQQKASTLTSTLGKQEKPKMSLLQKAKMLAGSLKR